MASKHFKAAFTSAPLQMSFRERQNIFTIESSGIESVESFLLSSEAFRSDSRSTMPSNKDPISAMISKPQFSRTFGPLKRVFTSMKHSTSAKAY